MGLFPGKKESKVDQIVGLFKGPLREAADEIKHKLMGGGLSAAERADLGKTLEDLSRAIKNGNDMSKISTVDGRLAAGLVILKDLERILGFCKQAKLYSMVLEKLDKAVVKTMKEVAEVTKDTDAAIDAAEQNNEIRSRR